MVKKKETAVVYKINISAKDGYAKGKTKSLSLESGQFKLAGLKLGQTFDGNKIGYPGYEFKITGGSDASGIPLRGDVHGPVKKRILISPGVGFRPVKKVYGLRKRKIIRWYELTVDTVQVNVIVTKYGKAKIFSDEAEVPAPETKADAKKEKK